MVADGSDAGVGGCAVAGCGVGPCGAVALAAPLSESGQLATLRLGWNRIGSKGAAALAGTVPHSIRSSLESIA